MANIINNFHRLKDMLTAIKQLWLNNKKNNELDPNDMMRTDPNDTPIETTAEERRVFDPIDTVSEVEKQTKDEPADNAHGPKM